MMKPYIKSKLTFAAVSALLFCAVFTYAAEVRANGNTTADEPVPPAKRSVQRAPVRRAPQKAPAQTASKPAAHNVQKAPVQPIQPTSLATGIKLLEQGRYKQAHPWLEKAVKEERGNPYAWYWYGMVHDKTGYYEQAQFFYARALELDPAFPPFSRVLAYPEDGDRKALWDPLRPARVYPVELGDRNVTIVPPDASDATSRQPVPGVDPILPRVPVYVPPEVPAAVPGDALQPPVYMPPDFLPATPDYMPDAPVYVPPPPRP